MADGIEVRGESLRIYFRHNGELCRELLPYAPTESNIDHAKRLVELINFEIKNGSFEYSRHFPNSARLKENTFGHYLGLWKDIKRNRVAPSTYRGYESKITHHIGPKWQNAQVEKIDHLDIQDWVQNELMPKLHNKTVREILMIMCQVFQLYRTRHKSAHDPTEGIDIPLPDSDEPDPFERAEINAILAEPTDHIQELNLIKFMMWSGPRVSEALPFAWEDVLDLEEGIITFRRSLVRNKYRVTKTKRSKREIKLLKPAHDALKAQYALTGRLPAQKVEVLDRDNKTKRIQSLRFVFVNSTTGRPHYSDNNLRENFFVTHLQRAGVRYRGPGQCRHTFASQLLSTGLVSAEWIADQMGHTSTAMIFKHYGKWIRKDGPDFVTMLNNSLRL